MPAQLAPLDRDKFPWCFEHNSDSIMISAVNIPATSASTVNSVSSSSSINVANFTMDRDKLTGRLYTMAKSDLPDFTVESKNADGHVNLQCSPAFYNCVAKQAVASLGQNYSEQKGDVLVCLPAPPFRQTDQTDLSVFDCYQFCVYDKIATESSLIGHVSVHLYHTKFLVTAAGSKTVPDGRTTAVWLATEILSPRLSHQRKQANFTPNTSDSIHQAIIKAFGNRTCKAAGKTKPTSLGGSCFACKGSFKLNAKRSCPGCFKTFHLQKKCFKDHICVPPGLSLSTTSMECVSAPPTGSPQFTFAPMSRKRPALDTTGFRPSTFRDVRSHTDDIDSDVESDSEWAPPNPPQPTNVSTPAQSVALPSSSLSGAFSGGSSPLLSGQQQMQRAIDQIASSLSTPAQPADAAIGAGIARVPLPLPPAQSRGGSQPALPPAILPPVQGRPPNQRKKTRGPAGTPDEFNLEMLKKELAASNARVASLDNDLKRCRDTEKIMSDRMALFEQRENDRLFATFSQTSATNPQAQPTPQVHTACCTPTICVTKELASVRLLLEDLQGSVNVLLRSSPHPPPSQPGFPPHPAAPASLPPPANREPHQTQTVPNDTESTGAVQDLSTTITSNSITQTVVDHPLAAVDMIVPHPRLDQGSDADDFVASFSPAPRIGPAPPPPPVRQARSSAPQVRPHPVGNAHHRPPTHQPRPRSYAAAAGAPPRRALLPTPVWCPGYEPHVFNNTTRPVNDRVSHHAARPYSRAQPPRPRHSRPRPSAPRTTPQVDEILIDLNF